MRNLKKLFAVIVAVAMLASIMVPALAADSFDYEDDAKKLYDLGLFKGTSETSYVPDLGTALTRETGLALMIRAMGKEEEVKAMTSAEVAEQLTKVVDKETINSWAEPYVAYAVKNGLTDGIDTSILPNIKFGGQIALSGQEFIYFMLKAMGYTKDDVPWDDALNKAVDIGMLTPSQAVNLGRNLEINRDDAIGIIAGSMVATTASGVTLAQKLVDDGVIAADAMADAGYYAPTATPEPTPAVLAVESVTSLNLKEIEVVFNQASGAARTNFLVNGAAPAADQFQKLEDGKVVRLFVPANLASGSTVKLVITGLEGIDTTKYEVVLNDNALPAVESVETVGNKLIKVTFTEPINPATVSAASFKIDNRVKSLTATGTKFNRVYNLSLTAALADGEYTLTINPSTVKDYAGNAIGANSTVFAIAKESAVPGYTVLEATQEMVKLQFDREPNTVDTIYWKSGSTEKHSAVGVVDPNDPTIYTFIFSSSNRLAVGENTVYMHKLTDYSGNKQEDKAFTVTAVVDLERPEFVSITQKNATQFEVKFSKDVVADSANYVMKDSQGISVTLTATHKSATDKKTIVLTASSPLNTDRNPFTLEIKGVIDTTYLANKAADVVLDIVAEDSIRPAVTSVVKSGNTFSINLNEAHDGSVTVDNFNYTTDGITYRAMPAGSYVEFIGTKSINLTVPAAWTITTANDTSIANVTYLNISGIKDIAGNEMVAVNIATATAAVAPAISNAYSYDKNTIIVTISNTELADVWSGDFVVTAGSKTLTVNNAELIVADTDVNKYAKTGTGRGFTVPNGAQIIKLTLAEDLDGNEYTVLGTPTIVNVAAHASVQVTKNAVDQALTGSANVIDNYVSDTPTAGNFTWDGTNIKVKTTFTTIEPVAVEYRIDTIGTSQTVAMPKTGDISVSAQAHVANVDSVALAAVLNNQIYVRFNDGTNVTSWVSIGTFASYLVDAAELACDIAEANTNKVTIDQAEAALKLATTHVNALAAGDTKTTLTADIATAKASVVDEADFTFVVTRGADPTHIAIIMANDTANPVTDISSATEYTVTYTPAGKITVTLADLTAAVTAVADAEADVTVFTVTDAFWGKSDSVTISTDAANAVTVVAD